MDTRHVWKVCIVGDTGVGKTCIAVRFHQDTFKGTIPTIGYAFLEKSLQVDEMDHKFNLWDTAGQERYRSLARGFFRRASAMIMVYDITSMKSFEVLEKYWIRSAQRGAPDNAVIAVVGNKSDLNDDRQVSTEAGEDFAQQHNGIFVEVSAKSGDGVHKLFEDLARKLLQTPELQFQELGMRILNEERADEQAKSEKNKCCGHLK